MHGELHLEKNKNYIMKKKKSKTTDSDYLQCKYCDTMVQKVWQEVTAVTCWKCTFLLTEGEILEVRK